MSKTTKKPDCAILGAGLIGLSLALELHRRGLQVVVFETVSAYSRTSAAAAGMLAANDPHNPPEIFALAHLSESLYSDFLAHLERFSGLSVPFQTRFTHQYTPSGVTRLEERSVDPRQLGAALRVAIRTTSVHLRERTSDVPPQDIPVIHATGAWHQLASPTKGQMLRVQLPPGLDLREVHRAEDIYIVPRTDGPQAGSALIGATVEQAGFDLTTHPADLAMLQARAARLVPELAAAPMLEAWAGLRPDTPDHLPVLGHLNRREFVATGHFRNGILLAPATAVVIADLVEGRSPAVDLSAFSAHRFSRQPKRYSRTRRDNRFQAVR